MGYTLAGLSFINREKIDAIRTAVWELEKAGYIVRRQGRDEKGKMSAIEYVIYEQPQLENPEVEKPASENPTLDNPTLEKHTLENPTQLNTYKRNKEIEYVIFAMERSKPEIRNIRAYLLTALYNAPATMDGYYSALVSRELNL